MAREIMGLRRIDADIVKKRSPTFYHKDGCFYALEIAKNTVGLLGIKQLTQENAELELLIFTPYRHRVLTRGRLRYLLDMPFAQGFKRVIIGTELKSMQRLCKRFEMDFMCQNDGKSWFVKERGH